MNAITDAITGALSRLDEENINQLYTILKEDIQKRYDTDLAEALAGLEENRDSEEHLEDLEDELIISGARRDKVLLTRARTLLSVLHPPDTDKAGSSGTVLGDEDRSHIYFGQDYYDEDEDDELEIG